MLQFWAFKTRVLGINLSTTLTPLTVENWKYMIGYINIYFSLHLIYASFWLIYFTKNTISFCSLQYLPQNLIFHITLKEKNPHWKETYCTHQTMTLIQLVFFDSICIHIMRLQSWKGCFWHWNKANRILEIKMRLCYGYIVELIHSFLRIVQMFVSWQYLRSLVALNTERKDNILTTAEKNILTVILKAR